MNKSYAKKKIVLEGYLDCCEDMDTALYALFSRKITSKDKDKMVAEMYRDCKNLDYLRSMRNYCNVFWDLIEKFKATNIGELLAKFRGRKARLTLEVELPKTQKKERGDKYE